LTTSGQARRIAVSRIASEWPENFTDYISARH
jgi:hypothetical protein